MNRSRWNAAGCSLGRRSACWPPDGADREDWKPHVLLLDWPGPQSITWRRRPPCAPICVPAPTTWSKSAESCGRNCIGWPTKGAAGQGDDFAQPGKQPGSAHDPGGVDRQQGSRVLARSSRPTLGQTGTVFPGLVLPSSDDGGDARPFGTGKRVLYVKCTLGSSSWLLFPLPPPMRAPRRFPARLPGWRLAATATGGLSLFPGIQLPSRIIQSSLFARIPHVDGSRFSENNVRRHHAA